MFLLVLVIFMVFVFLLFICLFFDFLWIFFYVFKCVCHLFSARWGLYYEDNMPNNLHLIICIIICIFFIMGFFNIDFAFFAYFCHFLLSGFWHVWNGFCVFWFLSFCKYCCHLLFGSLCFSLVFIVFVNGLCHFLLLFCIVLIILFGFLFNLYGLCFCVYMVFLFLCLCFSVFVVFICLFVVIVFCQLFWLFFVLLFSYVFDIVYMFSFCFDVFVIFMDDEDAIMKIIRLTICIW